MPSASAASSSRFASGCSGTSAKTVTNLLRDLGGRPPAVADDEPLREAGGEGTIGRDDEGPELRTGALDPVALLTDTRECRLHVDLDEHRPVGHEPANGEQVQVEDRVDPEAAAGALI